MLPNFVCAYPVSARIKILLAQCSDLDVVVNNASGRSSTYRYGDMRTNYRCFYICFSYSCSFFLLPCVVVPLLLIAVLVIVYEYKHEQRFIEAKKGKKSEKKYKKNVWADRIHSADIETKVRQYKQVTGNNVFQGAFTL